MPYKIEKNKDKSFKLINKQTGHILAEHTTPERAMKQIKAIHAHKGNVANKYTKSKGGMPTHHRIRKNVEFLQNRHIKNPKHHKFIEMTKKLLKHEEMVGSGFWGDIWDFTKDVLTFPMDVVESIPFVKPVLQLGLAAVGLPEVAMFVEPALGMKNMIYGENTNSWLKDTFNPERDQYQQQQQQYYEREEAYQPTVADVVDETVQDITNQSTALPTRPQNAREQILNPYGQNEAVLYNPLNYLITSANLAFPPTLKTDPRDQPQGLVDFLNHKAVACEGVCQAEYNAIINKQKPQTWISFPDNGYYKKYPSYQTGIN